jgi:hypothetical protein
MIYEEQIEDILLPVSTGTTILASAYKGGVVLAADSRTSTGSYVANRASDKITEICDNVFMCRSGSVRLSTRLIDRLFFVIVLTSSFFLSLSVCVCVCVCERGRLLYIYLYLYYLLNTINTSVF